MKTFDGYKKQALTDVYALLAGGGHKPLSEFSMAHTHPYLPLSGGTMLGSIKFNSNSLPQKTLSYICGIDAFADGGEMGWMRGSDFVTQYAPTKTGIGASGTWGISITGNAASATNADKVDGYHASNLWRSDGATWNPGANVSLNASGNNQEWSFDIRRNNYTGCYWQVWDSSLNTMLKVNADNGKVYAPYNFIGNLEGNATTATKLQTARKIWGQPFNGTANVDGTINVSGTSGNYNQGIRIHTFTNSALSSIWFRATNADGYQAGMWGISVDDNGMRFRGNTSKTATSDPIDYMNILHGGNVGIGITNPSSKLTINGDISLFNVGSIRNLAIGGGIYWNPYVESTTDGSDAASITVVKSGVAGGTTLVLSLMNDANDTILFKTSTAARLYHNSYPILTTLNTYVNNNKGYINGVEITLVNNASSASTATKLASSGYANNALSYYQTDQAFDGSTADWAHYIIANHHDGASYYHYTIRLPFWSVPQYRRLTGNTSNVTSWYNFITAENISSQSVNYATSAGNSDKVDGLHVHSSRNNEVNKIVRTDGNGFILAGWINTTSGDMGTTAINKIYCSNDSYIRYKTPANFFETLSNDGNQISITIGSQNRKLTVNYASFTKTLDKVSLPSSTSNAANTAWCKFARITFNNSAWSVASGYLFFGGCENPDNRAILVYHFRSGNTATTLSTANLYWLIKSYSNATVIAVKVADNVYDLYTNNSGTYLSPCIYHMSAFSSRFTWSIGNWTTTKPTAAYTSSDIGIVNYANSAGNADTIDNYHANGLLTALSNSNNGVSITVGGTTKSISNISVNYASSAGTASKWATARTLTLTGAVTGSVSIDGSRNVSLATTTNHTHNYIPLSGSTAISGKLRFNGEFAFLGYLPRKKEGSDSWAYEPFSVIDFNGSNFAHFGVYGSANSLEYIYIGAKGYNSNSNLKIYTNGTASASGFKKNGSNDTYVLLGGGGHKLISDFATAGHNHNSSYVSAISISGNYLRVTKNGTNSDLTIPFATTASKWATARTLTIGNTGKSVDGSVNVSWTLAEIGAATSGHTHTLSLASDTGTSSITLAHGGKYKLTAGGGSVIFTLPTDITSIAFSGGHISSSGNTLTQADHSIAIGGQTETAGYSTCNIINSLSINSLSSSSTTNLAAKITVNGITSAEKTITNLHSQFWDVTRSSTTSNISPGANSATITEVQGNASGITGNLPTDSWYHVYTATGQETKYATLLALGMTTDGIWYRKYSSSSWGSWLTVLHSGNIGNYYWANISISSTRNTNTTPQFGKVKINTTSSSYQLNVGGDSYTTGWSRAKNGFYCESTGVYFTHNSTKGEISVKNNNEFCWGSNSDKLYFNYAAPLNGTTVKNYIWNAGSSDTYASHTTGNITLGSNSNNNYQLKRAGSLSDWYNGRDKAIIRQTSAANGYSVVISSKTTNGSWEIGNESNDLMFTYITDSNYNSKNDDFLGLLYITSEGEVHSNNNIYATHFFENSDIRYKKILKNLSINSNIIANLPLFDFEWIENNTIGTGTSALAVQQILPNLVSGTDKLTLDYGVLGTIAGITACKELVILKSELLQLKEKVKLLEDKLRKYENT